MQIDWTGDHSGHPCILQTLSHHNQPFLFLCWPTTKIGPVPPFPLLSSHVGPYSSLGQGPCSASQPVAEVPVPNLESESSSSRLRSLSPPPACCSFAYPWLVWLDLLLLTAQTELENYLFAIFLCYPWFDRIIWIWIPESLYQDSFSKFRHMGFGESSTCYWCDLDKIKISIPQFLSTIKLKNKTYLIGLL